MRLALAACLLLVPVLAGCVSMNDAATDDTTPADTAEAPELVDALAALEEGEPAANVELLGEWRNGGAAEADAHGDLLYVMRRPNVEILNVSDPDNIREVASFTPDHGILDVKLSDDGKYLFIGDDSEASGALGGQTTATPGGTYVYDVSDPENPQLVTYQPIGERRGPHMVYYEQLADGREIVLGANADVSISEFDREAGTLTELARYAPDLVTDFNRDPEVFDVLYQGWAHDMFAMTEADGTTLMYVANWDAGLRVVDITDPANPKELGGWNDFPEGHTGNLHTVATDWVGDRRITVGAVEVGFAVVGGYHYAQGTDANVVYVWDTTDPENVELLGYWQNPVEPYSKRDYVDGEITSTHNVQFEEGRIYLAHYGMGIWVLDASTPETWKSPEVLGYYVEDGMSVWDVVLHEGALYSSGATGVLGLHYLPDALGPDGITSRA